MVYLITKRLKCPLQRSSYDEGHVVGRSYGCLEIAPCGEAYTRAASARIVRSEDGHPVGWPLLFCSLSPVAIRVHLRHLFFPDLQKRRCNRSNMLWALGPTNEKWGPQFDSRSSVSLMPRLRLYGAHRITILVPILSILI